MNKLETHLLLSVGGGDAEHEFPVLVVEYRHVEAVPMRRDGYLAGPAEPEHVELGNIYAVIDGARHSLPEWMVEPLTEQLEALCLDHWQGERDYALERRAEERREDERLETMDLIDRHTSHAAE